MNKGTPVIEGGDELTAVKRRTNEQLRTEGNWKSEIIGNRKSERSTYRGGAHLKKIRIPIVNQFQGPLPSMT
jgi:hypothetical protein